ncbi:non-canonical purine NTP pyrophosphatase [Helicobacter saguini]|nr:non-canonical purine NTP pyrophosphatase [Helicobacter saguini]
MQIILATNNKHKLQEVAEILANSAINAEVLSLKDMQISEFNPAENGATFEENAMIKARALCDLLNQKGISKPLLILADDSGLCVDALNGAPGAHSARFARVINNDNLEANSSDFDNRVALINALKNAAVWGSRAYFKCSIAYIFYNFSQDFSPCIESRHLESKQDSMQSGVVSGICEGIVAIKELGNEGFGYDNMFYIDFNQNATKSNNIDSINATKSNNLDSKIIESKLENIDFSLKNIKFLESLNHSLATLSMQEKNKISHRAKALKQLIQILQ